MLIGYASAARHYEGLTILNHSDLGGERSMLIGYALIARQKGGLPFPNLFYLVPTKLMKLVLSSPLVEHLRHKVQNQKQ